MKYLWFFTIFVLVILITPYFQIEPVYAVGICYNDKTIGLSVNPSLATTAINVSGTVDGDSTEEGVCASPCFVVPFIVVYQINTLEYRIDSGSWVTLSGPSIGGEWWVGITGSNTDCSAGVCGGEQTYQYDYSKDIDISGLTDGPHTIAVRATGGFCPSETITTTSSFTKIEEPSIDPIAPKGYLNAANPNPTFQAIVRDDNGLPVHAHFQVVGSGSFVGSTVNSLQTSSVGPITFFEDGTYFWYAWAENSLGLISSDSATYAFTRDTVLPMASISYPVGNSFDINIPVTLIESDERTGIAQGNVQIRSRIINGLWGAWGTNGTPNNGETTADFVYVGTSGYEYEFQYSVVDGAGNVSDWVSGGAITINDNATPTATNLNRSTPDFCSTSPAYFFSWIYSDADVDTQSRFDFQVDDSGVTFPSPEINRSYSGLSNLSPTTNNQAVIILLTPQADYLTYNRTYNWRVMVYDVNGLDSGWVNGTSFSTPNHRSPVCNFTWLPTSPNPGQSTSFTDSSTCYDTSGNVVSCASWNWTFTDGNPATSTQQNLTTQFTTSGTKDVILAVIDSLGSTCSITRQVIVSLPMPSKWKEIRPW